MTVQFTKVFENASTSIQVLEYARKFELGAWSQPDGRTRVKMLPVRMDADELLAFGKALQDLAIEHGAGEPTEFTLQTTHVALPKRGVDSRPIWLSDAAELHSGEVVAIGELKRAGLVEEDTRPLSPGPPCMPNFIITRPGLVALKSWLEAHHG